MKATVRINQLLHRRTNHKYSVGGTRTKSCILHRNKTPLFCCRSTKKIRKMGCSQSTAAYDSTIPEMAPVKRRTFKRRRVIKEYELRKYRTGFTGMFWRPDPTGETLLASNNNWPRDGARLRGYTVYVKGEKWLLVSLIKQKGSEVWKEAPEGAALPFEHNRHYYLGK